MFEVDTSGPMMSWGPQINPLYFGRAPEIRCSPSTGSLHSPSDTSLSWELDASFCFSNPRWVWRDLLHLALRRRTVLARSLILENRSKKSTDSSLMDRLKTMKLTFIVKLDKKMVCPSFGIDQTELQSTGLIEGMGGTRNKYKTKIRSALFTSIRLGLRC